MEKLDATQHIHFQTPHDIFSAGFDLNELPARENMAADRRFLGP